MAEENSSSHSSSQEVNFLRESLKEFSIEEGHCFGYFVGEEKQLEDFLDHLQLITSTCFIRAEYHSKERGHKRMSLGALPVFVDNRGIIPIKIFGHPFTIQSKDVRHCLHGSSKDSRGGGLSWKSQEHGITRKRKVRTSVKKNCTATMHIRGINVYQEYFVDFKCSSKKKLKVLKANTLKNIQNALEENANHPFVMERRFYMKIPLSSAHSGHQVGEDLNPVGRKIDERVKNKIYHLARCNVKNVAEIQRCLIRFVKDDLFGGIPEEEKPKQGNKRYYPRRSDIRTHIFKAIGSVEEDRNEQELAVNLINLNPPEWHDESFQNENVMNIGNENDDNEDDDDVGNDCDDTNGDASAGSNDDNQFPVDEMNFLEENLNDFHTDKDYCFGYFVGEEKQLEDFLDHLQLITSTCFIRAEYHCKERGHKRMSSNTRPVFEDKRGNIPIQMFGNPFLVISSDVRHCIHGSSKDSRGGGRGGNHEHDYTIRTRKVRTSVKRNCTATMHIRGIKVYKESFVDFKCSSKKKFKILKSKALKNIQNALEENANHCFVMERRFYMKIPLSSAHSGHQVGEDLDPVGRKIDDRVENKIYDLVRCNVKNVAEIQRCLTRFVKDDLFGGIPEEEKPKQGNKRYYPRRSDIRTHVSKAVKESVSR